MRCAAGTGPAAEGKPVTVEVYTDAEEAALYVNGALVERREVGLEKKARVLFETVYTPGVLETVVYKEGKETGRDRIETAGSAVRIMAAADTLRIPADGSDIAYVEISMTDEEGRLNPEAGEMVSISVEGPGTILGFGSADPESEEIILTHRPCLLKADSGLRSGGRVKKGVLQSY